MKKKNQYIVYTALILLMFGAGSCSKSFLEITPKGNLIAQKISDYDLLFNSNDLLIVSSTGMGQVPMGDEVAGYEPLFVGATLQTQRYFRWEDVIYEPDQDANEMLAPMKSIYICNKIINEVMEAEGGTEQQKKSLRAEAIANRAWNYFWLINFYGKPYSSSSSTDPGFPIIKVADITATSFTRASVQEVYDFIIDDLKTAIPDLPVQITSRLRMSRAAAEAILGKVYVFMGKYQEAKPLFESALQHLTNAQVPVNLYDYNKEFATGGDFLPIGLFGPKYPLIPSIKEVVFGKQFINNWAFTNAEILMKPETRALYTSGDLRLKFFSNMPYPVGAQFPLGMLRRKGPILDLVGMQLPDIYLLLAECNARLNDLPAAKTVLETLRKDRMPEADAMVPDSIAADQQALITFILDERIREFAIQGYRWFDMRRLSVDRQFSNTVGHTHVIYDASGNITETYTLKPERLVLRFPEKVINQNPGMQNNQ